MNEKCYYILELSRDKKIICKKEDKIQLANGHIVPVANIKAGMILGVDNGVGVVLDKKKVPI